MKLFKNKKSIKLLLPALFITILLAGAGLFYSILESLHQESVYSFEAYHKLWTSASFFTSLLFSLKIALIASLLSISIGLVIIRLIYPFLSRSGNKLLVWLPMVFPHFVWGYILYLLFDQSGWFSSIFHSFGWISYREDFPALIRDEQGIGILLTYVTKEVPFVILMLLPVYLSLGRKQREIVFSLGGTKWDAFKTVEWPVLFPVLTEIFFILFSFILTAYEVPSLLGATYPKMISVIGYEWFNDGDWSKRPIAYAALCSISLFIIGAVSLYYRAAKRGKSLQSAVKYSGDYSQKGSGILFAIYLCSTLLPVLFLAGSSIFPFSWDHPIPHQADFHGYQVLFQDPNVVQAIWNSISIAFTVIVLNFIVGIPAAKALAHYSFKQKALIEAILLSPLLLPSLLLAMGLQILFIRLGLANQWMGVVIIQLIPTLPYTIKMFRSAFEQTGTKLEMQAVTMGATKTAIFRTIYLPLLLPSFRGAIFLVSVISFGQYLLTSLIGGGNVLTLAMVYFPYFQQADFRILSSFSVLFAILPIGIWIIFEVIFKLFLPYKKRR